VKLKNHVALVTGGGSGIGRAVALWLAAEGADVALMGRRPEPLARVADEIDALGVRGLAVAGDVREEAHVDRVVSEVVASLGRLDIAVNCAGLYLTQTLLATSLDDWERVFATNLRGTWLVCKRVIKEMIPQRSGVVINVSSTIAARPMPQAAAYAISKAGVEALTKALALEVAGEGIRVNAVVPGIVDTPIHAKPGPELQEDFYERAALMHPLGRLGRPEDVASAVVYLASPESSWVTGSLFNVDGGISLA
jgi:NAD(P)-dependent dehydrogenase (short-subunit alcohol dehydrogenase family)